MVRLSKNYMDEETTPKSNTLSLKKKTIFSIIILVVIGLGGYYYLSNSDGSMNSSNSEVMEESTGPVAKVNGVEISRANYQSRFTTISSTATQQGADPADEAVKAQIQEETLNVLINTQLLIQSAGENGIEITDDQVEEEYQKIIENLGGADGLAEALKNMNLSEEDLRKDIREQLSITELIQIKTDYSELTVSDSEVSEYYQSVSASNPDVPELETVSEQIKAQLLAQKQQEEIGKLIETLRVDANIEILI